MNRVKDRWFSRLTDWVIRLSPTRPDEADARRRQDRLTFDTDSRRLALRMTEFLRDRLRHRWLKFRGRGAG